MFEQKDHTIQCINEDTVHCLIFSVLKETDDLYWTSMCDNINILIKTLSSEYIWHTDEFKLHRPIGQNEDIGPHLVNVTCFGDNLEDEWFIVHILLKITQQFPDLLVHVRDNDGDFLLIEAAEHLPSWANPDTTENRVFIFKEKFHLIPPSIADIEDRLELKDAVQIVVDHSQETEASENIQNCLFNRIGQYPEKLKELLHTAVVKLPLEIAAVLTLQPSLIAPIVTTYCSHDVIDAKACKNVVFGKGNEINVPIKFTKYLYAMLVHSKLLNNLKYSMLQNDKRSMLGLKITYGYHMIMKKSGDIFSSNEYKKFFNSLKENGYFKENIEGSNEYKKLLQRANEFFASMECPISLYVSNNISQLISSHEYLEVQEKIKNKNDNLQNYEQSDEWLTIHPEQLNELLNTKYGKTEKFHFQSFKNSEDITPQGLASELSNFLKKSSDYEGIETNDNREKESNDIDFNSDEFAESIEKMLKLLSSNCEDVKEYDSDDFSDCIEEQDLEMEELDEEIKRTIQGVENIGENESVSKNILQGIREEGVFSGPSSNLLRSMGVNKSALLDSDDDDC